MKFLRENKRMKKAHFDLEYKSEGTSQYYKASPAEIESVFQSSEVFAGVFMEWIDKCDRQMIGTGT